MFLVLTRCECAVIDHMHAIIGSLKIAEVGMDCEACTEEEKEEKQEDEEDENHANRNPELGRLVVAVVFY